MMIRRLLLTACLVAGCSPTNAPPEGPSPFPPFLSLPDYFDCLADNGLTQIAAHRGGPAAGYPENALVTFERTVSRTGAFLEVDVATSADGVLFLHHDDRLERTTTGRGLAEEKTWDELRQLSLKDKNGNVTAYGLTRLDDALEWAKDKTVLELDIKRSTDYDDVARIVKAADAEDRVIVISYTDNSAVALSKRLPGSMISVTIDADDDVARLEDRGIPSRQIVAWTGIEEPNPSLNEALQEYGVETVFGTLGGRDSLDRQFEEAGTDDQYAKIAGYGVELIATDRADAAAAALKKAGRFAAPGSCSADQ